MEGLKRSQKARSAIREFKTITDALFLRGCYKPAAESGHPLENALRTISPEIYLAMNDERRVEIDGLVYVIDRLPCGIESTIRMSLSAVEGLSSGFVPIDPRRRRRTSYRVNEREMCFEITRGRSEIYDLITHLTFLNIEARKIKKRGYTANGKTPEWLRLEKLVQQHDDTTQPEQLQQHIWNLSKILGRTFAKTLQAYERLEESAGTYNSGLFNIIYWLGKRAAEAEEAEDLEHRVIFTPSLKEIIDHHQHGERWAASVKKTLQKLNLYNRPLHIISANLHSVINVLYGFTFTKNPNADIYQMVEELIPQEADVKDYAQKYGYHYLQDRAGIHIDCQLIDTTKIDFHKLHPHVAIDKGYVESEQPVILVMDYAFGEQAFEVMDELLKPHANQPLNVKSISIMGKAGALFGDKCDILLPTAHVLEGSTDTYFCENHLQEKDFENWERVFRGPMVTVPGTSLQNEDVLMYFMESSWRAVGLEMEGGHYQKAIQTAMLRNHISRNVTLCYAYYASDNPLKSGQTLASGGMGMEGIKPTYLITRVILEKILHPVH